MRTIGQRLKVLYPWTDYDQAEEIRSGLEHGVDVSKYAKTEFYSRQMEEIRSGLEHGVDVSKYADPKFDWEQMYEEREKLEQEQLEKGLSELEINANKKNRERRDK